MRVEKLVKGIYFMNVENWRSEEKKTQNEIELDFNSTIFGFILSFALSGLTLF